MTQTSTPAARTHADIDQYVLDPAGYADRLAAQATAAFQARMASSSPVPPLPSAMTEREALAALVLASIETLDIPVVGGEASEITGGRTAQYGPVIRIEVERRTGDKVGVPGARSITVFPEADQAPAVLARFLEQGRTVYQVVAQQGCWHYRTDRPEQECRAGL